jgi:hypothetical protein
MRFLGSVIGITRRDKIRDDDDDASDKLSAELSECRNNWKNHI